MLLKHSEQLRRLACVVAPAALVLALAVIPGQAHAGGPNPSVAWAEYEWDEITYVNGRVVSNKHGTGLPPQAPAQPDGGVTINAAESGEEGSVSCKRVWVRPNAFDGGTVVYRFEHWKEFCWNYPNIVWVEGGFRWTDLHPDTTVRANYGDGYWYTWRGVVHGGQTSWRQGIIDYHGSTYYPWVQIWINGNGAWTYDYQSG